MFCQDYCMSMINFSHLVNGTMNLSGPEEFNNKTAYIGLNIGEHSYFIKAVKHLFADII